MKDVSVNDGRTVLFVSHNMSAVAGLCNKALILKQGLLSKIGETDSMIGEYLKLGENISGESIDSLEPFSGQKLKIRSVRILNGDGEVASEISNRGRAFLEIGFEVLVEDRGYDIAFELVHSFYGTIFSSALKDTRLDTYDNHVFKKGMHKFSVELPLHYLKGGEYYISAGSAIPKVEVLDSFRYQTQFAIIDSISPIARTTEGRTGLILPILDWIEQ